MEVGIWCGDNATSWWKALLCCHGCAAGLGRGWEKNHVRKSNVKPIHKVQNNVEFPDIFYVCVLHRIYFSFFAQHSPEIEIEFKLRAILGRAIAISNSRKFRFQKSGFSEIEIELVQQVDFAIAIVGLNGCKRFRGPGAHHGDMRHKRGRHSAPYVRMDM